MRENVLIRPLEWAYNSRALRGAPEAPHCAANHPADSRARPPCQLATAGLPVQYKTGMRQMLADQKQKADAAAKAEAAAAAEVAD